MKKRHTWVVTHCEYLAIGPGGAYVVDEMPHFAAPSLARALALIRHSHVDPGSWWGIYRVSDPDGPDWWRYASRGGRLLRSPPLARGLRAARKRDRDRRTLLQRRLRK